MRRATAFAFALVVAIAIAAARPAAAAGEFADVAFDPRPGAQLPLATAFRDEHGRTVPLARYFTGMPVILVLEYLRCATLCGVTLQRVIGTLDALPLVAGRDYQFVAVSIDPRDRPADAAAAKAKYAAAYHRGGSDAGMHFLTGAEANVRALADAVGFHYRYDAQLDQFIHPAGFLLAAPNGTVSSYVFSVDPTPAELNVALANARQSRVLSPLTRFLLLCHTEGLPIGRYTVPVTAAFALANFGAMGGLVALFVMIRRRRHG